MTPLGAVLRGLVAGAVGTLAMDSLWYLRYRRGGGKDSFATWEFSAGVKTWEEAPAPAQVGRRLVEGVFQRKLDDRYAAVVNNITHWGYGMSAGAVYGVLAGSLRKPRSAYGPPFGAAVWGTSYAVLPAAGLYKQIWEYDRKTLAKDLSAHLVFGATTGAVFRALKVI
ncbi:hypothetical protein Ade02nite_09640 [Paractinoplanes deccanensis]|uniref:DUF1440 domain-containing protein n=1 Tax=Paractinoplanes deccanensis TaxID=113561 RepID=A0ABQ3XX51_9ACTN|nr:hypothetical protein [Actinoplanes deccanensis]GID72323.1 hypothetical protein Ade02nite_09640 [Actinoplanes deccanensis]